VLVRSSRLSVARAVTSPGVYKRADGALYYVLLTAEHEMTGEPLVLLHPLADRSKYSVLPEVYFRDHFTHAPEHENDGDRLRRAAYEGKLRIEAAPQRDVAGLAPYMDRVLQAIGHPEAWVSDLSEVGDFDVDDRGLADVSRKLGGIDVRQDSRLADLAFALQDLDVKVPKS
jgi:hypothetical protein